jgi:hypothetical protein
MCDAIVVASLRRTNDGLDFGSGQSECQTDAGSREWEPESESDLDAAQSDSGRRTVI